MTQYDQLAELIEHYVTLFHQLTQTEETKLEAARTYDVKGLDACMKKEQAFVMQMKGYDKRRLELLEELSFQGKSFRQMIPLLPSEEQARFEQLSASLSESYHLFRPIYDRASLMLEVNGHRIETVIADVKSKQATVYASDGSRKPAKTKPVKDIRI